MHLDTQQYVDLVLMNLQYDVTRAHLTHLTVMNIETVINIEIANSMSRTHRTCQISRHP